MTITLNINIHAPDFARWLDSRDHSGESLRLLKQLITQETKFMATTKEVLDGIKAAQADERAAQDAERGAVAAAFKRLEDKITAGGQVSAEDLAEAQEILADAKAATDEAKGVTDSATKEGA